MLLPQEKYQFRNFLCHWALWHKQSCGVNELWPELRESSNPPLLHAAILTVPDAGGSREVVCGCTKCGLLASRVHSMQCWGCDRRAHWACLSA